MSKLNDLREQKKQLEAQIKAEEEASVQRKEQAVLAKLNALTDKQKSFILSQLQHSRTSCSDKNPCNGLSYVNGTCHCNKCMLIEIFRGEHGGSYDFQLTVDISPVTPD